MHATPPPRFAPRRREERPIGELLEFVLARYGLSLEEEPRESPKRPVRPAAGRRATAGTPPISFSVVGGDSLAHERALISG